MSLAWIRKEVAKSPSKIDWLRVIETARDIYREENESESILGLSKGFLNFVKLSSYYDSKNIAAEILSIYNPNDVEILYGTYHNTVAKFIKEGKISQKTINEKIVVLLTERTTVERLFGQLPVMRFKSSYSYKRVPGSPSISLCKWKKDGEKGISWEKGKSVALKRDNILDDLFS